MDVRLEWQNGGVPLLLARSPGARIAFTTRQGGVSEGSFGSLNLGFATGDDPARVAENRRRALAAAGAAGRVASLRQRHGVVVVDAPASAGDYADASVAWPEGDALFTDEPGLAVIAHGADCLTVALVAAGGGRLAVVHAGWRGLAAGVLEAAAERVGTGFSAVVGPGAGPCCYAVGEDVAVQLQARFGGDVVAAGKADLPDAARRALERAGAREVVVCGLCTICDPERFHSHRRDGAGSGRQAVIALLESDGA